MPHNKSHQISLLISMAQSSSLSMPTGEHLAFLRQEHRVELTQNHLKGEGESQHEHYCDVLNLCVCVCWDGGRGCLRYCFVFIKTFVIIILTS